LVPLEVLVVVVVPLVEPVELQCLRQ